MNFKNKVLDFNGFDNQERTDLCEIMARHGSDKGRGIHNYSKFYNFLFDDIKDEHLNIFEVGLGTNNVNVPSNMGASYNVGASLYGWEEYFKNSKIFGADVDKDILFNKGRIQTFFVDQLDKKTINNLLDVTLKEIEFDIIIDDGLHQFVANNNFLINSIHKLKTNGVYIIEDVFDEIISKFNDVFTREFCTQHKIKTVRVVKLAHPTNNFDNNLIVILK